VAAFRAELDELLQKYDATIDLEDLPHGGYDRIQVMCINIPGTYDKETEVACDGGEIQLGSSYDGKEYGQ